MIAGIAACSLSHLGGMAGFGEFPARWECCRGIAVTTIPPYLRKGKDNTTMSNYDAIIFDCDGTLVDTMPSHYVAWVETLRQYDIEFDEDRFYALGGWPTMKVAQLVIDEAGLDVTPDQLTIEKESRFEANIDQIEKITPVVNVVDEHFGRIPLAVGTGAIRRICMRMLEVAELSDRFQAIVAADDVQHHKPAPDTYLEAARRLGVKPSRCLVYEDTDPGIESARAAGMDVVDVREFFTPARMS